VYGDGMQVRDWLYVRDHCSAIRRVLEAGKLGETYNVGGWNEKPNIDIVQHRVRLLDELRPTPDGQSYRARSPTSKTAPAMTAAMPSTPARSSANWAGSPAETFDTGIRKTVQWYLDNADWVANVQSGAYRDWVQTQYQEPLPAPLPLPPPAHEHPLLGKGGQVGWELQRSLAVLGEVVALDFDSTEHCGDFSNPEAWPTPCARCARHHRQRRRAHRRGQGRERTRLARTLNATAPGVLAQEAARWAPGWCTTAPTTCLTAAARPWVETDAHRHRSASTAAPSSKASRHPASGCKHLILRTSWVYAARGGNFAKTMLRWRRARAPDRHRRPVGRAHRRRPAGRRHAHALRRRCSRPQLAGTVPLRGRRRDHLARLCATT
jgi:hypothetical protein